MPADPAKIREVWPDIDNREGILESYLSVRGWTESLVESLSDEDMILQSMTEASPAKWHLAHTTWFFEVLALERDTADKAPYDTRLHYLYNSYYESLGPRHDRPNRGLVSRPSVAEVMAYRAHIDDAMAVLIRNSDVDTWRRLAPIVELGLHHEQQHQELLLTDIKHAFSLNPLCPAYREETSPRAGKSAQLSWFDYGGGLTHIGHRGTGFAYDNEGPQHTHFAAPYRLASRLITNGEFLAFVEEGGYTTPTLWLSEGWTTINNRGWCHPLYWQWLDGQWMEFTLAGLVPLDPEHPVTHVCYYEAHAFANWMGKRLPREQEWEIAARDHPVDGNLLAAGALHPRPAPITGAHPAQLYGDVWEWTESAYLPYPGYKAETGALGEYNGKFMCNQHVLRGGSCATPPGHVRPTYRNFFPTETRWQFAGIRLAEDL